ncbi:MAG: hypothetical protein LJF04_09090 [Gemmatimonadetes bacterium]|nr:hypothetical protein [Gemmatimonadota bacterium]
MAQCQGTTKKGERCKRDAREGSDFCSIHVDQEIRPRSAPAGSAEWDRDSIMKVALGFALVGAVLFFRLRK